MVERRPSPAGSTRPSPFGVSPRIGERTEDRDVNELHLYHLSYADISTYIYFFVFQRNYMIFKAG